MKRFHSILVHANESSHQEAALLRAEALAARNDASVSVVDVLAPSSEGPYLLLAGPTGWVQVAAAARELELRRLVAPLLERGIPVETEVLVGKPFIEIIGQVLRQECDLVLTTANADGGGWGRLFGSTALHLLRKCPCPVWVVNRHNDGPHGRILAAVDPGVDGSERQRVSLQVLELAASLAESDRSELQVVHCWGSGTSDGSARWLQKVPPSQRHDLLAEAEDGAKRRLEDLLARCDLSRVHHDVRLEEGAAVDVIASLSSETDVLVMGTLSKGGAGVLIGSTAEAVLARVNCSVLAVKPESFVTPVPIGEP